MDLLMSADLLVRNATEALDQLDASLGIPRPKAPTRLEIISPAAPPDPSTARSRGCSPGCS